MVKTAEQKARDRYRAQLLAGKTPRTYNEANRRILEEERAKIAAGGADVREAPLIQAEAVAAQEAPLIPAEAVAAQPLILAVSPEALGFEPEQAEPEAVAPPLGSEPEQAEPESPPQSLCPPMPVVPAVPAAPEALARRPRKRPLPDSDPKPNPRANATAKFKRAHKAAEEHARQVAAKHAADQAECERRALVAAADAADQAAAKKQAERREQEMAERRARRLQQMNSECLSCSECFDMDYMLGPCAEQMCSKHRQRHGELVLRQSGAATTGAVSLA